jgi:hypothetical protein
VSHFFKWTLPTLASEDIVLLDEVDQILLQNCWRMSHRDLKTLGLWELIYAKRVIGVSGTWQAGDVAFA